jgi:hypothetical protein
MQVIEWKDETTYSRSNKERAPRVWTAKAGGLTVTVHRHIHFGPHAWLVTCAPWFDCRELPTTGEESAKAQALDLVRQQLHAALAELVA